MIISASYKTDIPTFYGKWFINRLHAGYCKTINPYGHQIYTISLLPEDVDGFVFWTKNIGPFLPYLAEVHQKGYPFVIQHTINGYPHELETRVIDYALTIKHMKYLANTYGSERLVWRYDPILFSSLTPMDWHRQNFATLAAQLAGTTNEVIISFAQLYRKTVRNIEVAAKSAQFTWNEHKDSESVLVQGHKLVADFAQIATAYGMNLKICAQRAFLVPGIAEEAHCIDIERIEQIARRPLKDSMRQKGNRKECACFASKDIGEYDTCPHGCVYCYAVQQRHVALERYRAHDPESEFLFYSSPPMLRIRER